VSDVLAVAVEWAAETGIPNGVFVAALLTRPSTWSKRVVGVARKQLGLGGGES